MVGMVLAVQLDNRVHLINLVLQVFLQHFIILAVEEVVFFREMEGNLNPGHFLQQARVKLLQEVVEAVLVVEEVVFALQALGVVLILVVAEAEAGELLVDGREL
jgi:hypothetical protein